MRVVFLLSLFLLSLFCRELWLLQQFDSQSVANNPHLYVYSEKLDGVRAYWDGKHLYSKGDKRLMPPSFFTQNFPPFPIEGELWSKRGDFENIVSIIKSKNNPQKWHELKFYIFEVPHQKGGILERLEFLQSYLNTHPAPFIQIIPQFQVTNLKDLEETLQIMNKKGAEGLVVRNQFTSYYTGRNKNGMKFKLYQDRECKIKAYIQGRGKYKNQVGAIECIDGEMKFKIGSGMSEEFRKNPPKIGTIITYKYFGLHKNNKPKFPVFLRIRSDESLNTKEKK